MLSRSFFEVENIVIQAQVEMISLTRLRHSPPATAFLRSVKHIFVQSPPY